MEGKLFQSGQTGQIIYIVDTIVAIINSGIN
jgi:hypothetical protein